MPAQPWKSFGTIAPEREYLMLLSSLPLKRWTAIHALHSTYQAAIATRRSADRLFAAGAFAGETFLHPFGVGERGGARRVRGRLTP